ncbi:MAG: hypothetical protein V2A79_10035 [Planctomycetota bacterium]
MKRILGVGIVLGIIASGAYPATWLPPAKYATQYTLYFTIYDSNSPWRVYETAPAAADVWVFQDGVSGARATNAVTDLGRTFSLVLTNTEMTAAVVTVDVNDDTATPLFGDAVFYIPTFGNASAYHVFDQSSATVSLAAGGITATTIASNAFTSDELATSFIDEWWDDSLTNNKKKHSGAWYVQRGGGGDPLAITGTAQAGGTTNTIVLAADTPGADDAFTPCAVTLLTGTGAWAIRTGVAYNSTTKALTILDTWPGSAPNATTTYKIEYAPTSALAAEGVAQAGTTNTIQLASGDVGADNLTGLVQLVSGTGAGSTVYAVTDSYDANDTIVISGVWAGAITPDTTTYYKFTPAGGQVSDASTPTPSLSVEDVQSAMTAQGYTTTLATNIGTTNTRITRDVNDIYDRVGDPNAASIAADLAVLEGMVDAIEARIGDPNAGDTLAADLAVLEGMVDSLEGRLTAVRAGYLDYLARDVNDLYDLLTHATYGLSAIHTEIGTVVTGSLALKAGTVATASTARSFTLSSGFPAVANAYPRGTILTFTDATTGQTYWGRIRLYTAGRVVTLYESLPAAPEAGDVVNIWPFQALVESF